MILLKIAEWCNGSTADSDSVSGGSNPSSVAKKIVFVHNLFLFFRMCYTVKKGEVIWH